MSLKKFLAFTCALMMTAGFASFTGGCEREGGQGEITPGDEEHYRAPTREDQERSREEMRESGGHRTTDQPRQ